MNMATEYGKRLKLARKHAGLTQDELSKRTGIRQSTISSAEVGGSGSAETAVFAAALKVNPLWLTTGDGPMELQPSTAPTSTRDKELASLSDDALEIAIHFDKLVNETDRRIAHHVAMAEILKLKAARDALPAALPTASPSPIETQEKQHG